MTKIESSVCASIVILVCTLWIDRLLHISWIGSFVGCATVVLILTAYRIAKVLVLHRLSAYRANRERLANDADEQNKLAESGDSQGIYGNFPPHQLDENKRETA